MFKIKPNDSKCPIYTPKGAGSEEQAKLDNQFVAQAANDVKPQLNTFQSSSSEAAKTPVAKKTHSIAMQYLNALEKDIGPVDRMFDSSNVEERVEGSRKFMAVRKEYGKALFIESVRPQIEELLSEHGDKRSFDEVVSIFGFNRLFMREIGSAGTDVDFFMLVDTKDDTLMKDIHALMKKEIAQTLGKMGIDMETSDFLMIRLDQYTEKLSTTHKSLFTLANADFVDPITGSETMLKKAFEMSDEQLALHFVALLEKNGKIDESNVLAVKKGVLAKIEESPHARLEIQSLLKQMASSELYIGKTPYKHKKTIQTELKKISPQERENRTAKISIKFNFNRIADMYMTTPVDSEHQFLSKEHVSALEKLSMTLSNIKCRIDDEQVHPLLKVQENYSDLTLEDIRKMSMADRMVIAELLNPLDIQLDPSSVAFPEACYDGLWALSDIMGTVAMSLEDEIFEKAVAFIPEEKSVENELALQNPQPQNSGMGWGTMSAIGLIGIGTILVLGLGVKNLSNK